MTNRFSLTVNIPAVVNYLQGQIDWINWQSISVKAQFQFPEDTIIEVEVGFFVPMKETPTAWASRGVADLGMISASVWHLVAFAQHYPSECHAPVAALATGWKEENGRLLAPYAQEHEDDVRVYFHAIDVPWDSQFRFLGVY